MVLGVPLRGILSTSKCLKLGTVSTNPVGTDFLFKLAVLSNKKKASRGVLLAICKAEKGREEMQGEHYTMGREMPLIF